MVPGKELMRDLFGFPEFLLGSQTLDIFIPQFTNPDQSFITPFETIKH